MEKNLEFIGEQLKKLTAIPSPSSYTEKAAEYLMGINPVKALGV